MVPALASAQSRQVTNGSFEQPDMGDVRDWYPVSEADMPGWQTDSSFDTFEIWAKSFNSVTPADGDQLIELNYKANDTITTNVCLVAGETVTLRFAHRGRAAAGTQTIRVHLDGATQDYTSPNSGAMVQYSWAKTISTGGVVPIRFQSLAPTGEVGNLLDNIRLEFGKPLFASFMTASGSGAENVAPGAAGPRLRLEGTAATPQTVTVTATGGTASVSDYTLTGTVTIPAGTYDGTLATSLPINFAPVNDGIFEPSETVVLGLSSPSSGVLIAPAACSPTYVTQYSYSITNDDNMALAISKNSSVVTPDIFHLPGAMVLYALTVTNPGVQTDSDTIVVNDVWPSDLYLDTSVLSPSTSFVNFIDGSPTSGLTFNPLSGVKLYDSTNTLLTPIGGLMANVARIEMTLGAIFQPGTAMPYPGFTLQMRGQVK